MISDINILLKSTIKSVKSNTMKNIPKGPIKACLKSSINNIKFTGAVFINNKPFSQYNHINHKTVYFNLFLLFRYKTIVLF